MREYRGSIEFIKEEIEYPHIIEELKDIPYGDDMKKAPDNFELKDKINEIIEVVNIMMRGGLR